MVRYSTTGDRWTATAGLGMKDTTAILTHVHSTGSLLRHGETLLAIPEIHMIHDHFRRLSHHHSVRPTVPKEGGNQAEEGLHGFTRHRRTGNSTDLKK